MKSMATAVDLKTRTLTVNRVARRLSTTTQITEDDTEFPPSLADVAPESVPYDYLISTLPMDKLVTIAGETKRFQKEMRLGFKRQTAHLVGIGVRGYVMCFMFSPFNCDEIICCH